MIAGTRTAIVLRANEPGSEFMSKGGQARGSIKSDGKWSSFKLVPHIKAPYQIERIGQMSNDLIRAQPP